MNPTDDSYRAAGVDISAAEVAVRLIRQHARTTFSPNVLSDIGFFSGLYELGRYHTPVLVSSTDGVGTKVLIASLLGRYDTVGVDLVNHCVNDILAGGAHPLFFLDYMAMGHLKPEKAGQLADGMASACRGVGCSLIGGETAQMPGIYRGEHFDLVGFIVGVVERDRIIDGSSIAAGDILVGIPSSGLHTNGYSLVRKVFGIGEDRTPLDVHFQELGRTLGEELLEPHRCYYHALKDSLALVRGLAHITGGGLVGNVPRILPEGLAARFDTASWPVLPIFKLVQERGRVSREEMFRVFNMGLGMVAVCPPDTAGRLAQRVDGARVVGEILSQLDERRVILG